MEREKVSIVKKGDRSVYEAVKEALDLIGGLEAFVRGGQKVLLKPNYTGDLSPRDGAVTSPEVLEALILCLHGIGVTDITIGEGCGCVHIGTMRIFENVGVTSLAEKYGVRLVDLNKSRFVSKSDERFREMKSIQLSEEIFGYDLVINVPVIKTHAQCVATCATKNMKGAVAPPEKRHFHAVRLHRAIADLQLVLPNTLTVVDGLTGQEGMGPAEGDPVHLDLILAGKNQVAVDGVVLRIMQIDPQLVKHVVYAAELGIGSYRLEDIDVVGEKPETVSRKFRLAETELRSYEGVEIYQQNACSGCINSLVIALNRMEACGDLGKFKDLQLHLGVGKPEGIAYKNFFYIGQCGYATCQREMEKDPNVHFIAGCAPAALEIEERIREVYGIDRSDPNFFARKREN